MADAEEWRFRRGVVKSWPAVFVVGEYIHSFGGRAILIQPLMLRPDDGDVAEYGDAYDLAVQMKGSQEWQRWEVKKREFPFTCCDDYPYPTIIVDRSEKADKNKPDGYFIVNQTMSHAAIIKSETKPDWRVRTIKDTTKIGHGKAIGDEDAGYLVSNYECPKELAKFVSLASVAPKIKKG